MARRVLPFAGLGLLALVSGCSVWEPRPERPAWRDQAENACLARKSAPASQYVRPAAEISGPGICGLQHPFKVAALAGGSVTLNSDATLGCPMLPALDAWIAAVVQPSAQARLGASIVGISPMGSYGCRPIDNQRGARLSEHAFGNALDIGGFRLSDGREISVVRDWKQGDEQVRAFLREVHAGACQYFTTVLGPGADVFHYNHIHLDLAMHGNTSSGPRRYCKPLPQNQPEPRKLDDLPDPPMVEEEQDVAQAGPRAGPAAVALARNRAVRAPVALALVPTRALPRPATVPTQGEIGDDGVFVPEGEPADWDKTSSILPRR